MLAAITVLLVYQLIGETLVLALKLPVPGPVIGMLLLFLTLLVRGSAPESVRETAQGILQHLSLLFVPAGVGVMIHFTRVFNEWLPILVSLVISTILTIVVTAVTLRFLLRVNRGKVSGEEGL
jgi:holin-like protein